MQTTRGNVKTCFDFAYVRKAKWAWKQNDKQIVQPRKLVEKRDVRKKNKNGKNLRCKAATDNKNALSEM